MWALAAAGGAPWRLAGATVLRAGRAPSPLAAASGPESTWCGLDLAEWETSESERLKTTPEPLIPHLYRPFVFLGLLYFLLQRSLTAAGLAY